MLPRCLLTTLAFLWIATANCPAHPGVSQLHLDLEIRLLEERLQHLAIAGSGAPVRLKADLADARYRLAIAKGASHKDAVVAWRDFEREYEVYWRDHKAIDYDVSLGIGARLALVEAKVRCAKLEGPQALMALLDIHTAVAKERRAHKVRADVLLLRKCLTIEDYLHILKNDWLAQASLAIAEDNMPNLLMRLQSMRDIRLNVLDMQDLEMQDIEFEIHRVTQIVDLKKK
jgi:hypothetical protein